MRYNDIRDSKEKGKAASMLLSEHTGEARDVSGAGVPRRDLGSKRRIGKCCRNYLGWARWLSGATQLCQSWN